jgi:hypothetical protein
MEISSGAGMKNYRYSIAEIIKIFRNELGRDVYNFIQIKRREFRNLRDMAGYDIPWVPIQKQDDMNAELELIEKQVEDKIIEAIIDLESKYKEEER